MPWVNEAAANAERNDPTAYGAVLQKASCGKELAAAVTKAVAARLERATGTLHRRTMQTIEQLGTSREEQAVPSAAALLAKHAKADGGASIKFSAETQSQDARKRGRSVTLLDLCEADSVRRRASAHWRCRRCASADQRHASHRGCDAAAAVRQSCHVPKAEVAFGVHRKRASFVCRLAACLKQMTQRRPARERRARVAAKPARPAGAFHCGASYIKAMVFRAVAPAFAAGCRPTAVRRCPALSARLWPATSTWRGEQTRLGRTTETSRRSQKTRPAH